MTVYASSQSTASEMDYLELTSRYLHREFSYTHNEIQSSFARNHAMPPRKERIKIHNSSNHNSRISALLPPTSLFNPTYRLPSSNLTKKGPILNLETLPNPTSILDRILNQNALFPHLHIDFFFRILAFDMRYVDRYQDVG